LGKIEGNNMHNIDLLIQNYFTNVRTMGLTEFMYLFTNLFDLSVYSVLTTLFMTLFIKLVRGTYYALFFLTSIITGSFLVFLIKVLFNTARPMDGVMFVFGPSFPSYHATIATIFFITLMYIFDQYLNSFFRFLFNSLCIFGIFVVAFSRVYLGVHWFSDVFFGVIIGAFFSYFAISTFKHVINSRMSTSMLK
jgi:membrane-associated phospholipid phosphatase